MGRLGTLHGVAPEVNSVCVSTRRLLGSLPSPAATSREVSPLRAAGHLADSSSSSSSSMMAIIGMFFQDGITGSAMGDWALYTASPLR
mmetsp:Transcript_19375/g.26022  ORF Transcript_19375/g.26022 Transcript_19375/m.26022 type:complete len:88 (-) Transcript_19375:208-471(-)